MMLPIRDYNSTFSWLPSYTLIARRKDCEFSHHKEIINVGSERYVNCLNVIIIQCVCELKLYTMFHKYSVN
jgi:hypothetical protein